MPGRSRKNNATGSQSTSHSPHVDAAVVLARDVAVDVTLGLGPPDMASVYFDHLDRIPWAATPSIRSATWRPVASSERCRCTQSTRRRLS